jgi:hypothetical protein
MKTEQLDYVLVPLGLAVMAGYHAWLLLRVRRRPSTTVIGVNAINRRIWVRHVMEVRVPFLLPVLHCLIKCTSYRALKLRIICMNNACTHHMIRRCSCVCINLFPLDCLSTERTEKNSNMTATQELMN